MVVGAKSETFSQRMQGTLFGTGDIFTTNLKF
jgi:hypothetical protein